MTFLKAYVGVLVAFLALDLVWITRVVQPMYEREVGALLRDSPRMLPAGIFYLAFAAGIVYFAVLPAEDYRLALVNGALFGGLTYGTFAFTNYAVLEGWTRSLVVADVAWGIAVSAAAAACGLLVSRL